MRTPKAIDPVLIKILPFPPTQGTAFYRLQSCANHSCVPTALALKGPDDDSGVAVLRASRPLAAGEEVTISYIDEDQPYL